MELLSEAVGQAEEGFLVSLEAATQVRLLVETGCHEYHFPRRHSRGDRWRLECAYARRRCDAPGGAASGTRSRAPRRPARHLPRAGHACDAPAAAAEAAHITIAWLPFRSPELNPDEDLWRLAKAQVAANRPYRGERSGPAVQALAEQAVGCIAALSPLDRLRCSGLLGSKFQWLST